MIKRIIALLFLLFILVGFTGLYTVYRHYQTQKAEREAKMQEKAQSVKVTLIEGWTVDQIASELAKKGLVTKDDFISATAEYQSSAFPLIHTTKSHNLEGYLFPDTYEFYAKSSSDDIIKVLLGNFSSRLKSLGVTDPDQKFNGLDLYQIVILASIIEKESGGNGSTTGELSLQDERNLIASVFYNRMKIGQALESDATINYVTKKDTPAVSAEDLQINSAYNTYKYAGLPPGPICNPSLGSLRAALYPAQSDYYYFLHKQSTGEVDFSKTFAEHKQKK